MMRKSLERPCPMKIQPRSTRRRSFLYASFKGVKVCTDRSGSRSPTARTTSIKPHPEAKTEHTFDTRVFRQIINDYLTGMYMVIDERDSLFRSVTTQNRYASQTETSGANNFLRPIRSIFCFFLEQLLKISRKEQF
jgi:hypothetical protein